jgi:hypothetical protein
MIIVGLVLLLLGFLLGIYFLWVIGLVLLLVGVVLLLLGRSGRPMGPRNHYW